MGLKTSFSSAFSFPGSEKTPFSLSSKNSELLFGIGDYRHTHTHTHWSPLPYSQSLGCWWCTEDSPRSRRAVSAHMTDLPSVAAGRRLQSVFKCFVPPLFSFFLNTMS